MAGMLKAAQVKPEQPLGRDVRIKICTPLGDKVTHAMSYLEAVEAARAIEQLGFGTRLIANTRTWRELERRQQEAGTAQGLCILAGPVPELFIAPPGMPIEQFVKLAKQQATHCAGQQPHAAQNIAAANSDALAVIHDQNPHGSTADLPINGCEPAQEEVRGQRTAC